MATAEDATNDSSVDNDDEDEYYWSIEENGMVIRKIGYDEYEIGFQSLTVTFDGMRNPDDEEGYELRDGYDTQGHFDPTDDDVPERVAVAFEVLESEI